MPDLATLISKLESWSLDSSLFHADRQLSDEILIADGWNCEPDPTFEGGFRWYVGTNPQYSTSDNRPHVLNDLNAAIGVVPYKAILTTMSYQSESRFTATVNNMQYPFVASGQSSRLTVAILIAALKYKQHEQIVIARVV